MAVLGTAAAGVVASSSNSEHEQTMGNPVTGNTHTGQGHQLLATAHGKQQVRAPRRLRHRVRDYSRIYVGGQPG